MNRSVYSACLYLLFPLILIYFAIRAVKSPDYRGRFNERLGLKKLKQTDVLFHSVSMGESLAAIPLIRQFMSNHPQLTVTVTATSPTGSAEITKALGDAVQHVYLPIDLPVCVNGFLKQVQPKLTVIMETELWPNLIHQLKVRGSKIMLANARLSAKSAAQYQKRTQLSVPMLKSLDSVAVQTQAEAERFIALGVELTKIRVCGSLKFDLSISEDVRQNAKVMRRSWGREASPVWVAGSVHPGEFEAILEAHQAILKQYPDALLIMVPRHPEQFDAAADRIQASQLKMVRRSLGEVPVPATQIMLGDTMGELLGFYAAADQAFVGGTLIENGGHNPLEASAMGLPVYLGPNHWDFAEIAHLLREAGALNIINSGEALGQALLAKFADKSKYEVASKAGLSVVEANKGALAKQLDLLNKLADL